MARQIPAFENSIPTATALSVTGSIKDELQAPYEIMSIGDFVCMVVVCEVVDVNHSKTSSKDGDDEVTRTHKVKVVEARKLDPTDAEELLRDLRNADELLWEQSATPQLTDQTAR